MAGKTILVSATLYTQLPQVSAEWARKNLAVRNDLMVSMEPQHPDWTFEPVTVLRAKLISRLDGTKRFIRPRLPAQPTDADKALRLQWHVEVAHYVHRAWETAAGSVLVLLTSYADLDEIQRLLSKDHPGDLLIYQKPRRGLDHTKAEFISDRLMGSRPILLVVGAGWTGFDVTLPNVPDALTDLVIPLMPYGTNRSITQAYREATVGHPARVYAATMMLRQGLGRLVRGPGVNPNRRIHFLDARWEQDRTKGDFHAAMRWITSRYRSIADV